MIDRSFWRGKKTLVTGHTGFKGGWLSLWLQHLGAIVKGYSLPPPTRPSFFELTDVGAGMQSTIGDVRNLEAMKREMEEFKPEVVYHLAAQPLVRDAYKTPLETYETNLMGTLHLLEIIRGMESVRSVVIITTDKCYENDGSGKAFVESDPMGGFDPYSNSKGCVELAVSAYYRSFLRSLGIGLATARAGNVIGGGDWGKDRIIPDFIRSIEKGTTLKVRYPNAIRPWQHVLDPLCGYLQLAQKLFGSPEAFSGGWNFGPELGEVKSVVWVIEKLISCLNEGQWEKDNELHPHEASTLQLDCAKAKKKIKWHSKLSTEESLRWTSDWITAWKKGISLKELSEKQIKSYSAI